MRFLLLLIMSTNGDVETTQIAFESDNQCYKAKSEIVEQMTKSPDISLHGAYCLEVRY